MRLLNTGSNCIQRDAGGGLLGGVRRRAAERGVGQAPLALPAVAEHVAVPG